MTGGRSLLVVAVLVTCLAVPPAQASLDKGIAAQPWRSGKSILPELAKLRADFLVWGIEWGSVAAERPLKPREAADPAYHWTLLDEAFATAKRHEVEIVPLVLGTPAWANRGQARSVPPTDLRDYANFLTAMSRRYPQVRRWMIWGEPSRAGQWQPQGKAGARRYAALLDKAYVAVKAVNQNDAVIGGNTQPSGLDDANGTSPRTWLRRLVLPNGRRPRFDLWGHNPFTSRPIDLRLPPLSRFSYDFNDIDTLLTELDRFYPRRRLKLFLSESGTPTEHANHSWFFKASRVEQAERMRQMFALAASHPRVSALSNYLLYDEPGLNGWTTGLRTASGVRKPAWRVFRDIP